MREREGEKEGGREKGREGGMESLGEEERGKERELERGRDMAGETGGTGRDLPLRAPLIQFPGWDRGGDKYITKMGPFYFSWVVFRQLQ